MNPLNFKAARDFAAALRAVLVASCLAALVLGGVGGVTGCGARPAEIPSASSAPWASSLLGAPSAMGLTVRPRAIFADPYWGPAMQRSLSKDERDDPDAMSNAQVTALMATAQMELYVSVRDFARASSAPSSAIGAETIGYVCVMHGVPGIDPTTLVTRRGERIFDAPVRLPSGVLELSPAQTFRARRKGLASSLFVMPDGTWVLVDQGTEPRARSVYAQTSSSPPRAGGDSLLAGFVDHVMFDAASRRASIFDAPWRQDLTGAGVVLLGGHDGAIELVLEYASSDAADRAKTFTEDLLVAACKERELACLLAKIAIRDVKVSRSGQRVGMRFYLTELVLQKLSES